MEQRIRTRLDNAGELDRCTTGLTDEQPELTVDGARLVSWFNIPTRCNALYRNNKLDLVEVDAGVDLLLSVARSGAQGDTEELLSQWKATHGPMKMDTLMESPLEDIVACIGDADVFYMLNLPKAPYLIESRYHKSALLQTLNDT